MNISILGAGAWGSALAISLAQHHHVTLWARDAAQIQDMLSTRSNQRYLPNIALPTNLQLSADLHATTADAQLIIIATPTAGLRPTLQQLDVQRNFGLLWLCKGFEAQTALLPHQIAAQILPAHIPCGALSGPSFAQEIARGLPAALTLAAFDEQFAKQTTQALHHSRLRVYSSTDVIGVEVGGAVKNIMAIAAGICDGLKLGNNARAALISRGLAEITRLGVKLGGQADTLRGLSGAGDLILTCTGDLSRNRQVGILLAQQKQLPEILQQLGHVAEGVYTCREVHQLAQKLGVDMPICTAVYRVVHEHMPAHEAVQELLNREANSEF